MIIYKCLLTDDEMFSDIFKITETKDGLFYEVEGKHVSRTFGDIDGALIGANASAEEAADDGTDASSETGVDIILNHSLVQTPTFDKKSFVSYLKTYMKALKTKLEEESPEKVAQFQIDAQDASKKMLEMVVKNKGLQFYTGQSMDASGAIAFLDYREDGETPFLIYFKPGLIIEKC